MNLRHAVVVLALLVASGCTTITKVGPGPVAVKDLTFRIDGAWNRFESGALVLFQAPGATEIWTREGFTLDVIAFWVGIGDGETIGQTLPRSQKKLPPFHATMAPQEILEVLEATITQDGSAFQVAKLDPARFGGGDGFRFEYTLKRKGDSLLFNGLGYGVVVGNKLYLMTFSAPHTYFYPKLLPDVEAVARSASIKR
jgi:hypothetical protein